MPNDYAIYLRKSRADLDAEARGEGETLSRHRTALRALAARRGMTVIKEYAELVTGDSIAVRPQMLALLDDVKRGLYAGVIVNDIDRLGRGDSIDQEIIKSTFISGNCLIITPTRDINPASPSDEDMLDFSMFFARFEYRKISQRLMQGRARSAESGNYLNARVPFGYRKVSDGKRITLVPDEDQAEVVKMIFDMYVSKKAGYKAIADKINRMGLKTSLGNDFGRETVKVMLQNPVYIGQIVWGKTQTTSTIENGHRVKRHIDAKPFVIDNAHPAIVDRDVFYRVQSMFKESKHASPINTNKIMNNMLSGLVYCSKCGRLMYLRGGKKKKNLTCLTRNCPTCGIVLDILEESVLEVLNEWCAMYGSSDMTEKGPSKQKNSALQKQLESLKSQIVRAQELVELGIYTPSEYVERKNTLQAQINAVQAEIDAPEKLSIPEQIQASIPDIKRVLDAYPYAQSAEEKNDLLKSVISRIVYYKTEPGKKGVDPASLLSIDVYPKLRYST